MISHTEEAHERATQGASLERRRDVGRYLLGGLRGDAEVIHKTFARNRSPDEGRVIAEPVERA